MFAASQTVLDAERDKRLVLSAFAAGLVIAGLAATAATLSSRAVSVSHEKSVDVSFRPPPPPPPPAKIDNPPPPPKRVAAPKPPAPVVEAPVAPPVAPVAAAAAMVAPKELPKQAPPESATPVAAIAVAVGGTGDGSGTALGASTPSEDDSPAPVEVKANVSGPVNLPEEADPPEPDENNAPPEYPEAMRATGHEARVVLKVVVEKDGTVGRVQVLKGEEPFTAAAIAAVKSWRFSPAQLDGQPIAVFLTVPVKFSLRE